MAAGNAVRRYFAGMVRPCKRCGLDITITEKMCAHSHYVCAPCQSVAAVESASRNRERKRANNNAWHAKNSANRAERTKMYRERHPLKRIAHQSVQTAIRNGSLIKDTCSVCGALKAHAHHDDYAKPLDVVWLCHAHHMERHAMLLARTGSPS